MNFIIQHKKSVLIGALIFLLLISLWYFMRPEKISAYSLQQQSYVPSLLLSGEVIAEGSLLVSAQVSGTVTDCPIAKGAKVQKGQMLVAIDDSQARVDRDRATVAVQIAESQLQKAGTVSMEEARVNSAQADLDLEKTEQEYERINTLLVAGAVSQADWEQAERNLKLAREMARSARVSMDALESNGSTIAILQAELQQRQLDLAEKEMLLDKYKILAPADGELLDIYVRPGELLSASSQVLLLKNGAGLRIKIQPDQRYASLAAVGNHAEVWIPNAASKWEALVVFIEPTANVEQGSLTAELEFTSSDPQLNPGNLLSVQLFGLRQTAALIVPESYLAVEDGQSGVWLSVDEQAHFAPVQIGLRTENGVVITQGLQEGDLVLKPLGLEEGQKILPQLEEV